MSNRFIHTMLIFAAALIWNGAKAQETEDRPCAALEARLTKINEHVASYDAREQRIQADIKSYTRIRENMLKTPADKLDSRILAYRNYISEQQSSQKAETDPEGTKRRVEAAQLSLQLLQQLKQGGGSGNPIDAKVAALARDLQRLNSERQQQLGDLPYRAMNELQDCRRQAGYAGAQHPPGTYSQPAAGDLLLYPLGGEWDVRLAPGGPWQSGGSIYSNMKRTGWNASLFLPDRMTHSGLQMQSATSFYATEWRLTGTLTQGGNVIQWSNGIVWRRGTGAVQPPPMDHGH